jgi:uncharacterized protein YukE
LSKAAVNVEDLKRLQKSVRTTQDQIQQAIKQLNRELGNVDWHDERRRSFEGKLKEATSTVGRSTDKLKELEPILQKTIADVNAYLRR